MFNIEETFQIENRGIFVGLAKLLNKVLVLWTGRYVLRLVGTGGDLMSGGRLGCGQEWKNLSLNLIKIGHLEKQPKSIILY